MIYNSMGMINSYGYEGWSYRLFTVKQYIDLNNKRPSSKNENEEIKFLGEWTHRQCTNFKTRRQIMNDDRAYNDWCEFINDKKYKKFFLIDKLTWFQQFKIVETCVY